MSSYSTWHANGINMLGWSIFGSCAEIISNLAVVAADHIAEIISNTYMMNKEDPVAVSLFRLYNFWKNFGPEEKLITIIWRANVRWQSHCISSSTRISECLKNQITNRYSVVLTFNVTSSVASILTSVSTSQWWKTNKTHICDIATSLFLK